jgi:hypothetical protein
MQVEVPISLVYDHNSVVITFGGLAPPAALIFMG